MTRLAAVAALLVGCSDPAVRPLDAAGADGPFPVVDAPLADAPPCQPESDPEMCVRLGYDCGVPEYDLDNCGTPRHPECGACTAPASCGGGGTKYVCGVGACEAATAPVGAWETIDAQTTTDLDAVWGDAAGTVWIVGAGGTVRRSSGGALAPVEAPTTTDLLAVFGLDAAHVWAAGADDAVYLWDGASWTALSSGLVRGPIFGLWASSADDVWAVGYAPGAEYGTTFHWDGAAWTFLPTYSDFEAKVYGVPGDHVWVSTLEGELLAFTGLDFASWGMHGGAGIWGTSSADLWRIDPVLEHRTGDVWSVVADGTLPYQILLDGRGRTAGDLWAVGFASYWFGDGRECGLIRHWDGASWDLVGHAPVRLHGVWPTATEVWAVGAGGTVLRLAR